jgi:hypothetical protein
MPACHQSFDLGEAVVAGVLQVGKHYASLAFECFGENKFIVPSVHLPFKPTQLAWFG